MKNQVNLLGLIGIALLGTIVLICTNGMTFSGITIFDDSILKEFGWDKSTLKFRDFVSLAASSLIVPFVGIFVDKYGAKKTIITGLILIGILYYCYSFIQTPFHVYSIHVGFAFGVAMAGTLPVIIMVSQRIKENRGTAIGIALAGTSAGGILIPQIGGPLLDRFGWRDSFQYEAIIPFAIMLLILFFLKPVNLGAKEKSTTAQEDDHDINFSLKEALSTPVFWAICFTGVFCFYAIMGVISNLYLYLIELDYTGAQARNAFSLFFLIILGAKFLSGVVTDYINEYKLFRIQLILFAVGIAGLALNSAPLVWPSLIAVGLGWGGLYTLLNYIIISTFGTKSAGKIGGIISTFEGIGSGLGAWVTALIADKTGSYSMSFWVVVGMLAIALISSFFIKQVKPPSMETSY